MANQSEMLHRLRKLYTPMPRSILNLSNCAEACAEYWGRLTPAQQNAVALLNRDAAIWKAVWDLGGPFQTVQNAYQSGYANGQQDALNVPGAAEVTGQASGMYLSVPLLPEVLVYYPQVPPSPPLEDCIESD